MLAVEYIRVAGLDHVFTQQQHKAQEVSLYCLARTTTAVTAINKMFLQLN